MSRIIQLPSRPVDEDGLPLPGYIPVGDGYYDTYHEDLPAGAVVVAEDEAEHGRYAALVGTSHAGAILEATWERTVDNGKELVREKLTKALSRNPTVQIIDRDLPPHRWMGEED